MHASLQFTAETYGAQVLGIRPDDVMFSAAKAFHAYGLGNCMTFPMAVGASAVFLSGRPGGVGVGIEATGHTHWFEAMRA